MFWKGIVLSKPRDFADVANNAGSGGVVNNNVTETINNVTVTGSAVSIFNQEFLATSSNVLTWTQNNGALPVTNLPASVHVYQNGQKLIESQYVALELARACGTPVITTDWGAFTETVVEGVTGFRCRNVEEFILATQNVKNLDRQAIRDRAISLYSVDVIAKQYEKYFHRLETLWGDGWYTEGNNANTGAK